MGGDDQNHPQEKKSKKTKWLSEEAWQIAEERGEVKGKEENHNFDYTDLCWQSNVSAFNMLSRLVIAFLPRSKLLLISCLQSPSAVILEPKKIKSVTVSIVSPSVCHQVLGPDAMILVFWMLSFKPAFSLSLQSKGLSRVFSNITVEKHQFYSTQFSLWTNSHIHTWLLRKP